MSTQKMITINNFTWDAEYLLEQIEMALQLTWKQTNEPATEGHNHCLICGYAFQDNEGSIKYRSQEGKKHFWLEPYCYERFIEKNGIEEIRRIVHEKSE